MRKLTIKRLNTFVGCGAKVKVYIEDKQNDELLIKGHFCRKIGEIRNNKELTVEIDENEHKIFVIFDILSKDSCCGVALVKEGTEDVILQGKCKFNPFLGNPFTFIE